MKLETKHYVAIVVVVLIISIAVTLGLVFGLPGSDSTDKKLSATVALKVVDAQGNEKIITPVANDIKQLHGDTIINITEEYSTLTLSNIGTSSPKIISGSNIDDTNVCGAVLIIMSLPTSTT